MMTLLFKDDESPVQLIEYWFPSYRSHTGVLLITLWARILMARRAARHRKCAGLVAICTVDYKNDHRVE